MLCVYNIHSCLWQEKKEEVSWQQQSNPFCRFAHSYLPCNPVRQQETGGKGKRFRSGRLACELARRKKGREEYLPALCSSDQIGGKSTVHIYQESEDVSCKTAQDRPVQPDGNRRAVQRRPWTSFAGREQKGGRIFVTVS